MKSEKREQQQKFVLTCPLKNYGIAVKDKHGSVTGEKNILDDSSSAVKIVSKKTGDKPYIIVDLGKSTPGGYPIFKVKSQKGTPVLRISYSDWYDWLLDPKYGETGDYLRGMPDYLGVELPVPPANPYRYELYTISAPGVYASPMIQGQQRAVRIQLDTAGEVELEWYYIENVSDMSEYTGYFNCSDEKMTKLWYASAYTCQIAAFKNSNSWEIVNGKLAARGLAKGNDVGLMFFDDLPEEYSFEFVTTITNNPGPVSSAGWVLNAENKDNCIVFRLDLSGRFFAFRRVDGLYINIKDPVQLKAPLVDNVPYHIKTTVSGDTYTTYLDGKKIDVTTDDTFEDGVCGFCQGLDQWAFFENVYIRGKDGGMLFGDDFTDGLINWDFNRTLSFISDGAKRDRLPWSGDLDWAGRNYYYSFGGYDYMRDTLRMFAFNSTPEGYVWATCYPENEKPPEIGEYGYYQSDIFSAWVIPTLGDYLLYSGDIPFCAELYDATKKNLEYLWKYVEADGLHFQRYETSKGLYDHILGSTIGKFTYMNILIWDSFVEGAFIAEHLGFKDDAKVFLKRADIMKKAILEKLWHKDGYFVSHLGSEEFCFLGNGIALTTQIVSKENALKLRDRFKTEDSFLAKFVSHVIKGFYEYELDDDGIDRIYNPRDIISWFGPLEDDRGPSTTWECCLYPVGKADGKRWADLSHPDTALCHIMTGFMLGVQPTKIGFKEFRVKPLPARLEHAEGCVPTIYGDIEFSWKKDKKSFKANLVSPCGTLAEVCLPVFGSGNLFVDGKAAKDAGVIVKKEGNYLLVQGVQPGSYEYVVK